MRFLLAVLAFASSMAFSDPNATRCDSTRWEPLIVEAATRFEIPTTWIRAILRAESAGCEHLNRQPTTSEVGAMGLMQLMPPVWNQYRQQLKLGDNAYDPRDNILAGAAYLRDLYDRYGWPAAAAAYHAGPQRYEDARSHARPLPPETLEYLARIDRFTTQKPPRTANKPLPESAKANALFVELRHRKSRSRADQTESPDVQN